MLGDKKTGRLVQLLLGDDDTVNVATGHPYEPMLAVSGIDNTVKIFSPDQIAQAAFIDQPGAEGQANEDDDDVTGLPPGSRRSRRRLHQEYRIRSHNEAMRDNGVQEALITVSILRSGEMSQAGLELCCILFNVYGRGS